MTVIERDFTRTAINGIFDMKNYTIIMSTIHLRGEYSLCMKIEDRTFKYLSELERFSKIYLVRKEFSL